MICFFPDFATAQPGWHLVPSFTLSETYDSNLFLREANEEDSVTRLGANWTTLYNGPNVSLRGTYLVQMQNYARHTQENGIIQDGSFDVDVNRWFQKLFKTGTVTLSEDFTFTPELQDYYFDQTRQQVGALSSNGIRTGRSDSYRNAFSVNLSIPVSARWNTHGRYSNLLTEYKDPVLADNFTNTVTVGTDYAFVKNAIYTDLGTSHIQWDRRDTYSTTFSLGVRHDFERGIKADLNAGVIVLDSEREDRRATWSTRAEIARQGRYSTIHLGFSRTQNPDSGIATSPPVAQMVYLNLTNIHRPGLTSTFGANYADNKSLGGGGLDTRSYNLSAGAAYQIRKWLQANLTASHFNQSSKTSAVSDIRRDLISMTLTGTWL